MRERLVWSTKRGSDRAVTRIFAAAIASLSLAMWPATYQSTATAAGFCFGASSASDKVFVDKDSSELGATFDFVRGDGTVGTMNPCIGGNAFPYASGSWILLANVEDVDGGAIHIQQVGFGKGCTSCTDDFIWTPSGNGAGAGWPGTLTPEYGHRVRGIIERKTYPQDPGVVYALYTIRDVTTGVAQTASNPYWDAAYVKAWWGAEALDTSSEVGVDYTLDVNVAYMGYSTIGSSSVLYRSGMNFNVCYCEDPGTPDAPSSVEKQGGTNSKEHGHLGDWVYGHDMVNFESH